VRSPQIRLGEAVLAIAFLAVYFAGVATSWDGFFWLHSVIGPAAILFPTYLVLLLMWRHYRGGRLKKDRDRIDEL
jgi:hypothetical protein